MKNCDCERCKRLKTSNKNFKKTFYIIEGVIVFWFGIMACYLAGDNVALIAGAFSSILGFSITYEGYNLK